jgi:hypothetical protein
VRLARWRDGSIHIVDESVDEPGELYLLCGRLVHAAAEVTGVEPTCPTCKERAK